MTGIPRCGYVAIVGAPNAGKSTLLNQLTGLHLAAISHKVQTTRRRVLGIVQRDNAQLLFIDTPGLFQATDALDRAMVASATQQALAADVTILLADATQPPERAGAELLPQLASCRQLLLALNKIDLLPDRRRLLPQAEAWQRLHPFADLFMIAATTGDGLEALLARAAVLVPESPWLYPEDDATDLPQRELAAELTREQIYRQLHDELPYAAMVRPDRWEERPDGSVRIQQTILVERPGQKAIVIGAGGSRIRSIGTAARAAISELLGRPAHLLLEVGVDPDWRTAGETWIQLGLERPR